MKRLTFADYSRYRESIIDDRFGHDQDGDGIEKLNRFMLLALADQDIRGSMYPILQQIAGQDETGEMQNLLRRIDIPSLGKKAKMLLKNQDRDEDESDPLSDEEKANRMDIVKPNQADTGQGADQQSEQ